MVRFKTQLRGYDKKQVDEYIHKTTEFSESKIRELEGCIERLKEENDYLYAKNADYRRNEERVSAAIVKAMEVKGSLEKEFRAKVSLEEDRLNLFKQKWTAYVRGIRESNADRVLEDTDGYIRRFKESFFLNANRDLNMKPKKDTSPEKSYYNEQKRIREAQELSRQEKMSAASLLDEKGESAAPVICPKGFIED